MKVNFFINFDFGIRGDYKGLYRWLDKNKAEERGNNYARITNYEFPDEEIKGLEDQKSKNIKFINYLRNEIKDYVTISSSDRIYLTFKMIDSEGIGGSFLFGKKQSTPWEGHYVENDGTVLDFDQ